MTKKVLLFLYLTILVLGFFGLAGMEARAEDPKSTRFGLNTVANSSNLSVAGTDLATMAGKIIGTAFSFISVIFFGLMLFGGFRWMFSRGNDEEAKKAMDTIVAAVIGLVIILSAYSLTKFVFSSTKTQTPEAYVEKDSTDKTGKQPAVWCIDDRKATAVCYESDMGACGLGSSTTTYQTRSVCEDGLAGKELIWCIVDNKDCVQSPIEKCATELPSNNVFDSRDGCITELNIRLPKKYYIVSDGGQESCVECTEGLDCLPVELYDNEVLCRAEIQFLDNLCDDDSDCDILPPNRCDGDVYMEYLPGVCEVSECVYDGPVATDCSMMTEEYCEGNISITPKRKCTLNGCELDGDVGAIVQEVCPVSCNPLTGLCEE